MWRNLKDVWARKWKPSQNEPQNQFFLLNSNHFLIVRYNRNKSDSLPCTASLTKFSNEFDLVWGSYDQNTTQKQSEIILSAAK